MDDFDDMILLQAMLMGGRFHTVRQVVRCAPSDSLDSQEVAGGNGG